jgi:hypothetical protein
MDIETIMSKIVAIETNVKSLRDSGLDGEVILNQLLKNKLELNDLLVD